MWGKRLVAVTAAAIATVALAACEGNTVVSVNADGVISEVGVEARFDKSTAKLMGIGSVADLQQQMATDNPNVETVVTEEGDEYVARGVIQNPGDADVIEALTSGEDEKWRVDTGKGEDGAVTIEIVRDKIDTSSGGLIDFDAFDFTRYLTIVMPNEIETIETLPSEQAMEMGSNSVRITLDDAFTTVKVTSAAPEGESNSTQLLLAIMGFFLIVVAAGWFLTLWNKDRGLNEDGTTPQDGTDSDVTETDIIVDETVTDDGEVAETDVVETVETDTPDSPDVPTGEK